MTGLRQVVVAGASAAGLTAAEALRRGGFDGTLTLVGAEPELPYDRPPLSKQLLTGAWDAERTSLRDTDALQALDLDLRLGVRATGLSVADRTLALDDGAELGYDALVIATGVAPRLLPGCEADGVHVLRDLADALHLRERLTEGRRLVIVGAGFLGAEVAATARGLGVDVTLVEPAPIPLAHAVGADTGSYLAELHRSRGVDLRLGASVDGIVVEGGRASGVRLAGGELLPADEVLVAIGSVPNTGWLEGSGLTVADGVVCDEYCAAAPGVWAAGDVARWQNPLYGTSMRIEHRTNAAEQGLAVARNMLQPASERRPFAPVPYFWSDQYDTKIQAFGYLRGHEEARIVAGHPGEGRFLVAYRTDTTLVGALAVGMPPKALRPWRAAVAAGRDWAEATEGALV